MLEIIITAALVFLTLLLLWFIFAPKKWKHDQVGWGYPTEMREKDRLGYQDTYNCAFCDRPITKDSQGNWFHLQ